MKIRSTNSHGANARRVTRLDWSKAPSRVLMLRQEVSRDVNTTMELKNHTSNLMGIFVKFEIFAADTISVWKPFLTFFHFKITKRNFKSVWRFFLRTLFFFSSKKLIQCTEIKPFGLTSLECTIPFNISKKIAGKFPYLHVLLVSKHGNQMGNSIVLNVSIWLQCALIQKCLFINFSAGLMKIHSTNMHGFNVWSTLDSGIAKQFEQSNAQI